MITFEIKFNFQGKEITGQVEKMLKSGNSQTHYNLYEITPEIPGIEMSYFFGFLPQSGDFELPKNKEFALVAYNAIKKYCVEHGIPLVD